MQLLRVLMLCPYQYCTRMMGSLDQHKRARALTTSRRSLRLCGFSHRQCFHRAKPASLSTASSRLFSALLRELASNALLSPS
jgi:hypothetical protein